MTFHFIYKTTNLINNKIYIGKHSTKDLNDGYLGSGLQLAKAIQEYGIENFVREILSFHNTAEEALIEESKIVDQSFVDREDTYNIALGGSGGILTPVERLSGENHYLNRCMTPEEKEAHTDKYKRGNNYWISKGINPEDKQEWIDKNWSGKNHSHRKKYSTEEEYQEFLNSTRRGDNFWLNRCLSEAERNQYIEENYIGKNNPIFKNKTTEEIENWLEQNRRSSNAPNAKYVYEFEIDGNIVTTTCLKTFCLNYGYNLHILRKIIERDSGLKESYTPREEQYLKWRGKRYLKKGL